MHPEYSKLLVSEQLADATGMGVFTDGAELEEFTFPMLYVRFRNRAGKVRLLRFDATAYDLYPMIVDAIDPVSRASLMHGEWLRRNGAAFPGHPDENGAPFLCFEGNRKFYTHPSHLPSVTGKRWDNWRIQLRLAGMLVWIKNQFAQGVWE